jgi:prepilin-type N-terminal cleavage/methylation domain-containing protein
VNSIYRKATLKSAFTLIELLVVIAIIAILAAILFPVFAQAKLAAKKTADLSNCKQIGTATQIYLADADDMYFPSNHRIAPAEILEVHWSWMLLPYTKNEQMFVSPADKIGGWAPGCFNAANNNRGLGVPGIQINGCTQQGYPAGQFSDQVGRISYVANQAIVGRKRGITDTANVVSGTAIDNISGTIFLAPATESQFCMQVSAGGEYRSYRPAFGIGRSGQRDLSGSNVPAAGDLPLEALLPVTYRGVFACADRTTNGGLTHTLRYTNRGRFDKGNNYVFADSSAKFRVTDSTFNVQNYAWGSKAYSLGGLDVVNPATGLPVQ